MRSRPRRYPTVATGRAQEVEQSAPSECPNGHAWTGARGPVRCRVSTFPCLNCGSEFGYHFRWTCARCAAEITDPEHDLPMDETFPPR